MVVESKTKNKLNKSKAKKLNKSSQNFKKRNKLVEKDDEEEEENEEEEGEEEEEEEEKEREEEEEESENKNRNKKNKIKSKSKGKKQKKKDDLLNRSAIIKSTKKLNIKKGKMKQNRSVILKKKNLLNKVKNPKKSISNNKRSQSVTNKNKNRGKINNKMIRTTRSEKIKGRVKKFGFFKNKNINKKYFNRTTQSEQKHYKKRNKSIEINKKRSKTPNISRYKNKFIKNKKIQANKFSKTDISIRSIPKKNLNLTHRTFNNRNRIGYSLKSERNQISKRRNYLDGFHKKRESEERLRPLILKGNRFMQNTQNFFNPSQRKLNLFKSNFEYTDREKEEGFYNRITLYPKNLEQEDHNSLKGDNLNPYSTNWPSSFLKIGYSSGFYYDDYQDGVPILRLKKLRNKIILPPIHNSRYSQFSEKVNDNFSTNFNYLSRQERINYILNTENNIKDNVFSSGLARRKLLDKFNIKGFDLPSINDKKEEKEEEENEEEGEEEEDDDDEEEKESNEENKEDNDNEKEGDDNNGQEEDEGSSSHPNEIE